MSTLIQKVIKHHRKLKAASKKGKWKAWSKNMLAIKKLKAKHESSR